MGEILFRPWFFDRMRDATTDRWKRCWISSIFFKKAPFGASFFGENKVARFLKIVYYDLQPCEKIKLNIGDAMKEYVNTFMRYRFLLGELVKKGIKLKYRRSYLGIVWSLLEPLLTMIVLTIVFGTLFGNKDRTFPVYILTGRLMYSYFSNSTSRALKSVRANAGMIKKVYVPKYIYPLSSVLYNYVIFLISLIVLAIVSVVLGIQPTIYMLQIPIALILVLLLSYGIGMILATVGVFFRDMEYLWSVALMIIMYTCAVFYYPSRLLKSGFAWILKYNPLYCTISIFRSAMFGEMMNMHYFEYALGFALVTILVGMICFKKKQDEFILYI